MNWVLLIIILFLINVYIQEKNHASSQKLVKEHYLKMLLISTQNEKTFYKLLLRKYLVDSKMYDPKPVNEFNKLWVNICSDVNAWTIGADLILEKEKIVPPEVAVDITNKTFADKENKVFISWAKALIAWDVNQPLDKIKKAVKYKVHAYGEVVPEQELAERKRRYMKLGIIGDYWE